MGNDTARKRVGAAIRDRLTEIERTQEWLGSELARREGQPEAYRQNTVSGWISGMVEIPPHRLFLIEKILGIDPGGLSYLMGYVPVSASGHVDTETAINRDRALTDQQREVLVDLYQSLTARTAERRSQRPQRSK